MADKTVAVIGVSEAAAWKTELLAAAGAQVVVLAKVTDCCAELMTLPGATLVAGSNKARRPGLVEDRPCRRRVGRGRYRGRCRGASLRRDGAKGRRALQRHRQASILPIPVRRHREPLAGRGRHFHLWRGPILGQAIRRRIETLLPQILSAWAGLAHTMRDRVMAQLPSAANAAPTGSASATAPSAMSPHRPQTTTAWTRHSAGHRPRYSGRRRPRSADLLTVKAIRAMQTADVILFDDLVSAEVLELARREAKRMLVGKRAARESCRQEDINEMMLTLARQGKNVVRLKSGDPMIFGRAGRRSRCSNGTASACPSSPASRRLWPWQAAWAISLTHRDYAQSVRFITGHSRKGSLPDGLNWPDLADPAPPPSTI